MPKKISKEDIENMVKGFLNGDTLDKLSKKFNCTELTVSRHLKKNISEIKFKNLKKKNINIDKQELNVNKKAKNNKLNHEKIKEESSSLTSTFTDGTFVEIAPLNFEIEHEPQKDLSSESIRDFNFSNVVYMVVDKKIELEIKYLKEFPQWHFLSEQELNRKTIAIYNDLKIAKRFCNKEQKVLKVPNTDVFKIVAPILLNKGITRIVNDDKLIAL